MSTLSIINMYNFRNQKNMESIFSQLRKEIEQVKVSVSIAHSVKFRFFPWRVPTSFSTLISPMFLPTLSPLATQASYHRALM